MSKMLKTHRNTIGNLMITLLFVGGCVFLLTGSWDASETEAATGCCGGGGAALSSLSANSVGDLGSGISMDAESTGGCCGGEGKITLSSSGNNDDEPEPCACIEIDSSSYECSHCDPEDKSCGGSEEQGCGGDCACDYCSLTVDCKREEDDLCSGTNEDTGKCENESY